MLYVLTLKLLRPHQFIFLFLVFFQKKMGQTIGKKNCFGKQKNL